MIGVQVAKRTVREFILSRLEKSLSEEIDEVPLDLFHKAIDGHFTLDHGEDFREWLSGVIENSFTATAKFSEGLRSTSIAER